MENSPSPQAAQGEQVAQGGGGGQRSMQTELGVPTVSMSIGKRKLLLQKQKSSSVNTPTKPPAGKQRKPSDPSRSTATKRRKLRSVVWKDFEPIYEGSLVVQAKCIHCLDVFAADRENGRSSCHRHLEVCKQRIRMNQMVDNTSKWATSTSPSSTGGDSPKEPPVLPLLQELADCLVLPTKFLSQLPRNLGLDPTALHMENSPSSQAAQGEQVAQGGGGQRSMQTELGVPTASGSVAKRKSLLQKQKSSSVNTPKAPAGKRRKPSGLNLPILMRLLSLRTGHPGAVGLRLPSMRGNGSRIVTAQELPQD